MSPRSADDRRYSPRDYELHLTGGIGEEARPGTVVLLGPSLARELAFEHCATAASARTPGLVLRFDDEPLRRGMELFPELGDAVPLLARARQGVQFLGLGEGTIGRFRRIQALQGLGRFSEFTALLNELAQWRDYRLLRAQPPLQDEEDGGCGRAARIRRALHHIRENYAEELSLAQVGAVVGMRANALSHSFRDVTGQTFTGFVIGLRVDKASRLLVHTRRHVSSICYEVGFNNISNFNRHFRRLKGTTPGKFRLAARTQANAH